MPGKEAMQIAKVRKTPRAGERMRRAMVCFTAGLKERFLGRARTGEYDEILGDVLGELMGVMEGVELEMEGSGME